MYLNDETIIVLSELDNLEKLQYQLQSSKIWCNAKESI